MSVRVRVSVRLRAEQQAEDKLQGRTAARWGGFPDMHGRLQTCHDAIWTIVIATGMGAGERESVRALLCTGTVALAG